jgi:hypothetical protein
VKDRRGQNEDAQGCAERLQQREEAAAAALEHADALPLHHGVGQHGTGLLEAEVVERQEHRPEAGQLPGFLTHLRGSYWRKPGCGGNGSRASGSVSTVE